MPKWFAAKLDEAREDEVAEPVEREEFSELPRLKEFGDDATPRFEALIAPLLAGARLAAPARVLPKEWNEPSLVAPRPGEADAPLFAKLRDEPDAPAPVLRLPKECHWPSAAP